MPHVSTRHALAGAVTLLAGASAAAAMALPATAAAAAAAPATVYVAVGATPTAPDHSCASAAFQSIQSAISAVAAGGRVVVCGGTYHEDVAVSKPLSLAGEKHAVIDAAGLDTGILVTASHVRIAGFTVTGAIGEGILVESVSHVTIAGNVVTGNDQGASPPNPAPASYPECQPAGGVPGDCGEGIHLMGTSWSTIAGNVVKGNTGGILLTDETGPAAHNDIIGNATVDNLYDCGITLAGHNGGAAPNGVPAPATAGVYANLVEGNTSSGNGTGLTTMGTGAGVLMATALPGGAVYDNTVTHNALSGNGLAGVTVHSHVGGEDLNGNVVTGNLIGVNNLDGDNAFAGHVDDQTTGVLAGTVDPLTIDVAGNVITGDHFGIWTTGPVTVQHATGNLFINDAVDVAAG
jgi:parallel beta-helix repeat protein